MDILLIILGILCLLAGLAGCILPALPGPPLAYGGMLLLHFTDRVQFGTTQLVVWLVLVVVVQVLDYFVPLLGAKYSGGSRWGERGCLAGTLVGLFFSPPFRPWLTGGLPTGHSGEVRPLRLLSLEVCGSRVTIKEKQCFPLQKALLSLAENDAFPIGTENKS